MLRKEDFFLLDFLDIFEFIRIWFILWMDAVHEEVLIDPWVCPRYMEIFRGIAPVVHNNDNFDNSTMASSSNNALPDMDFPE